MSFLFLVWAEFLSRIDRQSVRGSKQDEERDEEVPFISGKQRRKHDKQPPIRYSPPRHLACSREQSKKGQGQKEQG